MGMREWLPVCSSDMMVCAMLTWHSLLYYMHITILLQQQQQQQQ